MLQGKIPKKTNLFTRGINLSNEQHMSVFCCRDAENVQHLFMSCGLVESLWRKIYGWLDITSVQPAITQQHYLQFRGLFKGKEKKNRGMAIWHAVVWTVWLERNDAIFNNRKTDTLRMLELVKCRSWSWINNSMDGNLLLADWCLCPLDCTMVLK